MTTAISVRSHRSIRRTLSGAIVALAFVASSCSAPDDGPVVAIGASESAEAAGSDASAGDSATGDLEYGDSIIDFDHANEPESAPANIAVPGFRSVEWEELVAVDFSAEAVLERFEEELRAVKPGSPEADELYDEISAEYDASSINTDLDSDAIQLAGFIAPLTYDGDSITEFLLVPFFGACIHVPPPPANQTVMVTLPEGEGLGVEASWGAVWVAGELTASATNTDLATAGYTIAAAEFGIYEGQ